MNISGSMILTISLSEAENSMFVIPSNKPCKHDGLQKALPLLLNERNSTK